MLAFKFQARDNSGKVINGQIDAEDQATAAATLVNRNLMVVALKAGAAHKAKTRRLQGSVKAQELVIFTRQLATMMDAGLPLIQTLTALEEQTDSKGFKPVIRSVMQKVEAGD